jgi:ABC-type multidrug transport system fused ATPase/permease subunit
LSTSGGSSAIPGKISLSQPQRISFSGFIAQHLTARLREDLFDHLQRISLDWHDKQKKGDLVQRITGNGATMLVMSSTMMACIKRLSRFSN